MRFSLPLLLCLLAGPASADFITGRVVDANGVGVPGVDIDVDNIGSGGDPDIFNDGTDANGFFTTTLPSGIYDIFFRPPGPPTTTLLAGVVSNVVVVGTKNMGNVVLELGVALNGRMLNQGGFPVANVNLDVIDVATGLPLLLKDDKSDAFGNFAIAIPKRAIEVEVDTNPVIGQTLVPKLLPMNPTSNVNLGDLVLETGFTVTGTIQRATGGVLANQDVDFFDVTTGLQMYTPADNSNGAGVFSVILPMGNYDLEICPPLASRLVASETRDIPITGNTNLGSFPIASGFILSGIVRDPAGAPIAGIDLDARDATTSTGILTCGDDSLANGSYAVVVPTGTLDVGFAYAGFHGTAAEDLHTGLVITGDTQLDGNLPGVTAGFTATPVTGTAPLVVSFANTSSGLVTNRAWNFGDGTGSNQPAPNHTFTAVGTYDVRLSVLGPNGSDELVRTAYITVTDGIPVANFDATPTSGLRPLSVGFQDLSSGTITGWSWSFGDGTTSALQNPAKTYDTAGVYSVSLTTTGPGGSDSLTRTNYVTVDELAPIASFTGAPTAGARPLTVNFADASSGPVTSWAWSFGDGAASTSQNPAHVYTAAGTYSVSLTATGPGGSDAFTRTNYVTVDELAPVASFVGTPTSGAAPLDVAFTDSSTGGAVTSWAWSFGDGATSTLQNPTHVYSAAGTFTVGLTVTGPGGSDTSTQTDYIAVETAPPVLDFAATPTTGSTPLLVNFTSLLSGGPITGLLWIFGDGTTSSNDPNPTHLYTTEGIYTVTLAATGPGGNAVKTKRNFIVVGSPAPVAGLNAAPTSGSVPLTVAFGDASTGPVTSWLWDFGDGATSTAQDPTHVYTAVGAYTVSFTVTGDGGTDTVTLTDLIQVSEVVPTANFTGSPTIGFAPLNVAFSDTSTGPITSWAWDFGDGAASNQANPAHVYTTPGLYTVSLTANGPGGSDTRSRVNFVQVLELPPIADFSGDPRAGRAPLDVQFADFSLGNVETWLWNFGDGATSSNPNPAHVYTTPGTYAVSLTVTGPAGVGTENKVGYITVTRPPGRPQIDPVRHP